MCCHIQQKINSMLRGGWWGWGDPRLPKCVSNLVPPSPTFFLGGGEYHNIRNVEVALPLFCSDLCTWKECLLCCLQSPYASASSSSSRNISPAEVGRIFCWLVRSETTERGQLDSSISSYVKGAREKVLITGE